MVARLNRLTSVPALLFSAVATPLWGQETAVGVSEAESSAESGPILDQLAPLDQIRIFSGLFVILVLGLLIYLVIKAGAHMVKGMSAAAERLPADSSPREDDWASRPLNEPHDEAPDQQDDHADD